LDSENPAREGISNPEVLALAASDDRVLITHDVHTMPKHFSDFSLCQME
jgi:hypothetical protein